jgi:iron(III) transport system substrate-binding protein
MTTRRTVTKMAGLWLAMGAIGLPFDAGANERLSPNLALASYAGADREARILAAAKAEGQLTFYTSIAEPDLAPLIDPFQDKYGIQVNIWRAGDEEVVQRVVAEAQGHRYIPDAVHTGSSYLDALRRERLLQPVMSPVFADLMPETLPDHRQWAATMLSVWVQAYNTHLIKKADLPTSYEDLLLPKWKGRLGIEAKSSDWFATVVLQMGREKGIDFFRELVARNGVSARTGNSLLNNLVAAGEVPMALEVYNYMPAQARRKGAPIDWFLLQPAAARANGVALLKHAPHPAAGMLLYDYLLSVDAQKILAIRDYVPTNRNVRSPFQGIQVTPVDPAMPLVERTEWTSIFDQIFLDAATSRD